MNQLRVFKFGGASVKDAAGIRNVGRIVKEFGQEKGQLLVVSAMGKTTNALENLLFLGLNCQPFQKELFSLRASHEAIARELFEDASRLNEVLEAIALYFNLLSENLASAARAANPDFVYDQVVSAGEYLSSVLLFHHLKDIGCLLHLIDASTCLQTSDQWREGDVKLSESGLLVQAAFSDLLRNGMVLTQGFIGGTADGLKTTLGREGSDYTAALLAYFLDAESVTIWKDVPGVLSADPRWMPEAVLLPQLSYQEAAELTYYGATVIHPKTIRPLAWKKIPLYVRSFLNPDANGTLVGPEVQKQRQEAYIRKTNQALVSMSSRDFSFMDEAVISELLHSFASSGLNMQMLQVSATSISIVTDENQPKLEKAFQAIHQKYSVKTNRNLTLITIQNPGERAAGFRLEGREPILMQKTRSSLQLLFSE